MQGWWWTLAMAAALAAGFMLVPVLTVRTRSRLWPALLGALLGTLTVWAVGVIGAQTGRAGVAVGAGAIAVGMAGGGYALAAAMLAQVRVRVPVPHLAQVAPGGRIGVALVAPVEPAEYRFSLVAEELTDLAEAGVELPPFPALPFLYAARRSGYHKLGTSGAARAAQRIATRLQSTLNVTDPRFGTVAVAVTEGRPRLTDVVATLSEHEHDRVIVVPLSPGEAFRAEKALAELDEARPAAHGIRIKGTDFLWADEAVPRLVANRIAGLGLTPGPQVGIVLLALGRPPEWDRIEPEGARQEKFLLARTRNLLADAGYDPARIQTAFLEWGEPDASMAIDELAVKGCTTLVLVPTTIPVDGMSTLVDLPRTAEDAREHGLNVIQLPAWGDDPRLTAALCRSVTEAARAEG